jgi:MoaA/NifB/PqqE/SkfB family radical SAM enzyme/tetratricopeptide (TPR) repeat protein
MTGDELRIVDEKVRNFTGKAVKSACYAPFVELYLTATGEVLACCRNMTFILGDLRNQRLTDIWNGGRIETLRKALTDYKFNLGCTYCEWEALRRSDSFAIRLMSDHLPVDSPHPEWPAVIEFNGSNTCNLECIMCCGENSSSIRGNIQGLPPLPKVYDEQFFSDLRQFLPHLHFINFLGGEPFLSAETNRIWDMMIEDRLMIPCRVTTNGTQYNHRVERALNAVPMHITVSIDGATKETYEMVRHRANFETVIANLHRFHSYTRERGTNFGISYCLMRQNWREVGDIVLLAEYLDCELTISMVAGPSNCTLFTLPIPELRHIVDQIAKMSDSLVPQLKRHRKAWEETVEHLRTAVDPVQLQRMEKVMAFDLVADTPLLTARRLASEGDYDKALRKLQGIRSGHADSYFALALSSHLHLLQGELDSTEQDLEEAFRLSRKLPQAYLNLARLQFKQGKADEALENARLAEKMLVPEERFEPETLVVLGVLLAHKWQLAETIQVFRRLAALPQPTLDGAVLPDSQENARRCVDEIHPEPGGPQARRLAGRVGRLYRQAVALNNASPLSPTVFDSMEIIPGKAAQALLPTGRQLGPRWSLRVAGVNNRARLLFPAEENQAFRVDIAEIGSGVSYDIQLNYSLIEFAARQPYRLQFRARADRPRTVGFGLAKATAPWSNIGLYRTLELATSWQEVDLDFIPEVDEGQGRLHFDLGENGAPFEIEFLKIAPVIENTSSR